MYVLRLPLKGVTWIREVRGIPAGPMNGGAEIAIDEYGLQFEGILAQDVASGEPPPPGDLRAGAIARAVGYSRGYLIFEVRGRALSVRASKLTHSLEFYIHSYSQC